MLKKLLFLIIVSIPISSFANNVQEAIKSVDSKFIEANVTNIDSIAASSASNAATGGPVVVFTTEKIPGAKCTCAATAGTDNRDVGLEENCNNLETRKYRCEVEKGMTAFQNMIQSIVRWLVYIIMLLGVLAIVGLGIFWAVTGSSNEGNAKIAKTWATNIIIGLIILFAFGMILRFLAPWIYG